MSTEGLQPVVVDQFGGLCTLIDRADLPVGLSPDCSNVEFFPGGVRSRSGFSAYLTTTSAATGLYSYVSPGSVRKLLILQTNGTMQVEYPEATVSDIPFSDFGLTTTSLGTNLRMRGTTLFGRAYFGLYRQTITVTSVVGGPPVTYYKAAKLDPVVGPFQYDGTTILPVAQARPSASFTVTPSAGGTMDAGRHDFCVVYETSTGYVTLPSDAVGATFTAGQDADLADLPIGPGAVIKRIVFATPANSSSFFTLSRFSLNDNTTTTLTGLTFTDSELLSGTSLEDYIDREVPPACVGVEKYGRRLVYWGGQGSLQPFYDTDRSTNTPRLIGAQSLTFDERDVTLPYPWVTAVGAPGAGGSVVTVAGAALQAYRITGDGVSLERGQITQSIPAYVPSALPNVGAANVFYMVPGNLYSIRARAKRDAGAVTSSGAFPPALRITLYATPPGGGVYAVAGIVEECHSLTSEWQVYTAAFSSVNPITPVQVWLYCQVTVSGSVALDSGMNVYVDEIQIFGTPEVSENSLLRISPPDDPETINPATGIIQVAENDGQAITDVFELRGNLYICKEHSLYVTTDNGDDPVNWAIDRVSSNVGTPSPHGVALGDGWAVIASRDGAFYFTGGVPEKISQEIQPTWDSINWGCGQTVWVTNDSSNKRIYFGVPIGVVGPSGGQTVYEPNTMLVLDYTEGFGDPISSGGVGRKWSVWTLPFVTGTMAERDSQTQTLLGASGTTIAKYDTTAVADWTGAVASHYETAPVGTEIGRCLFDRLIMRVRGSGSLVTQSRRPGGTLSTLTAKTLSTSPDDDVEIKFHSNQTQLGFRIGTSGATDYWNLRRLGVFIKPSVFTYLRKT